MTIQPHQRNSVATFDPDEALHFLGYDLDNPAAQAALALCQRYELDPFANHIILIPGRPYPYVTRDGHLWLAHRSRQFDGMEVIEQWADDKNAHAKVKVWRKDMSHAFTYTGRAPLKVYNRKRSQHDWDEHADKKAVANAEVRALKRAFPLQLPSVIDLEDDGGQDINPPDVLPPSPTPGEVGERVTQVPPGLSKGSDRHDPTSPGPTSPPVRPGEDLADGDSTSGGGSDTAIAPSGTQPPPDPNVRAGARTTDTVSAPGSGAAGPDTNPTTDQRAGDAIAKATDRQTGSAVRGEQPKAVAMDDAAVDPALPSKSKSKTRPGDVIRWLQARNLLPSRALTHLRREHPEDFGDLRSVVDLGALSGEQADRAIAYLGAFEEASKS